MSLKEQLSTDLKTAMRAKDNARRDVIRSLQAAIKQKEVDGQKTLDDDGVLQVLMAEAKKRNESIEAYESAGRRDSVESEKAELVIIQSYLPKQLSRDELRNIAQEVITAQGVTSVKELGKVMPLIMSQVKGQADGRLVNEVVRELLQ